MITMTVYLETQSHIEGGKLIAQSLESSGCRAADAQLHACPACLQHAAEWDAGHALQGETHLLCFLPSPLLSHQMVVCSHSDEEQTFTKIVQDEKQHMKLSDCHLLAF